MKKALSLLLALVLCLSLCACSIEDDKATEPVETISMKSLLSDTDNGAKAQLNVGKATTIYGQITTIDTSACKVKLFPKGSVSVEMPIEELAELNPNQFIVLEGIVKSYNSSSSPNYTITATELLDLEVMDSYIKEEIALTVSQRESYAFIGDTNAGILLASLQEQYNINFLEDYVYSRGDAFLITDDNALKEYLIGNWVYYQNFGGLETLTLEYKADDTSVWYYKNNYDSTVDQCQDWSVSYGAVDSIWSYPKDVYVLHEEVFLIYDFDLYVKVK